MAATSDSFGLRSDLRAGASAAASDTASDAEPKPPLDPAFPYTMTPFSPAFFDWPTVPIPVSDGSDGPV